MVNDNNFDNLQLFQLKECYDLATLHEKDEIAKKVLMEKAKSIEIPTDYFSDKENFEYKETEMQTISDALYALSLEGNFAPTNSIFKYKNNIDNISDSGEKEYILTLLSLRKGMSETNRIEALRHISTALTFSPNDSRYITLAKVLEEAGR
jgi:hypothetical protein